MAFRVLTGGTAWCLTVAGAGRLDGRALGDRRGEQRFLTVGGFSGHDPSGTRWRRCTEAPVGPARGSQPRGPGWPARPQGAKGKEGLKRLSRFHGLDRCRHPIAGGVPVVGPILVRALDPIQKWHSIAAYCSLLQFLGRASVPSRRAPWHGTDIPVVGTILVRALDPIAKGTPLQSIAAYCSFWAMLVWLATRHERFVGAPAPRVGVGRIECAYSQP